MGSDRARISLDRGRGYRAIVQQQGRVTLEADGNEGNALAETALRDDVIDIVGPWGTPDDGYKVTAAKGALQIGAGIYYLGGWRLTLPKPIPIGGGPDALDLPEAHLFEGNYAVALLVTEQEVSAAEDRALREVALGGPDTAARTRLMQRGVAVGTQGTDCPSAAKDLIAELAAEGATWDVATGALKSTARLTVVPVTSPSPPDPCDPPASGGYLGADNQLIRVSVTAFDPATKKGTLVWGYDNASTLYRASTTDGAVLTLLSDPIDSDHTPQIDQAVEVLQTRKLFDHGEVIAADAGPVTTVIKPYDADRKQVTLGITLDADQRGDDTHPLFLRLWQAEIAFEAGTQVELGTTGLAVLLDLGGTPGGDIVARPFWAFAARPFTPQIVYPRRYLDAPQPPEGPRQWLAPLAVVNGLRERGEVLDDCRETFLPLTKLRSGCCGVLIDPAGIGGADAIQRTLDRLKGTYGSVVLKPGVYQLREPIRLDSSHKGLTIEGCGDGVILAAADENDPAFREGLIVLDHANDITLKSLHLTLPVAELTEDAVKALALATTVGKSGGDGSIGISATGSAQLTVSECQFRFRLRTAQPILAFGLLQRGECWGLRLIGNRFLHDIEFVQNEQAERILIGHAVLPAVAITGARLTTQVLARGRLDTLLSDAELLDNQFVGLTYASVVFARLGDVRVERNRVKGCSAGIFLIETAIGAALRTFDNANQSDNTVGLLPLATLAAAMSFSSEVDTARAPTITINADDLRKASQAAELRARSVSAETMTKRADVKFEAAPAPAATTTTATGAPAPAPSAAPPSETKVETPPPATQTVAGDDGKLLGTFERLSAAVESHMDQLAPAIHISGNDIEVFGTLAHVDINAREDAAQGTRGLSALQVVFDERDNGERDLIVLGNRIVSNANPAVVIAFPLNLVVSANIVAGNGFENGGGALTIITNPKLAMLEVMGNVVRRFAHILPTDRPVAPSTDWSFVNRLS